MCYNQWVVFNKLSVQVNKLSVQEEKLDQIYVTRCKKNLVYHSRWKVPI